MDITIETIGGVTVIRLNGTLDARSVHALRDRISALITAGATQFVVDELLVLLDLSGLRTIFEVCPDVPAALARFAEAAPPAV
jgi:anti-anti-sigma factor